MTTGSAKAFTVRGKVITKEHCKIYEGLVEFESGNTTRAICKVLSQSEDFDIHQREAALYSNQLFALQDESVPRFLDRKSTRLNSSHSGESRMPSSA